ncbi:Josephin-1 [Coemansia aciculifera]|nr:Josephin-1 [Coemansia aciculifera]
MKLRESPIYHEKQSFWLCAKLQEELYTHADLERIAKYLHEQHPEQTGWLKFNSHKNFLGFGDYDVNVIALALQEHGYDLLWHDNRSDIEEADLSTSVGLIVHIQPEWFFRRGHWFAIKHFDQMLTTPVVPVTYVGQPRAARDVSAERRGGSLEYDARTFDPGFWNLDSKLVHPEHVGERNELNTFLRKLSKSNRVQVLLVVPLKEAASSSASSSI